MKIRVLVDGLVVGHAMRLKDNTTLMGHLKMLVKPTTPEVVRSEMLSCLPPTYRQRIRRASALEVETDCGLIVRYQ